LVNEKGEGAHSNVVTGCRILAVDHVELESVFRYKSAVLGKPIGRKETYI
jgi:hypothetical protein